MEDEVGNLNRVLNQTLESEQRVVITKISTVKEFARFRVFFSSYLAST